MNLIYTLLCLAIVAANPLSAMPERYQLVSLGVAKHTKSFATGINDLGQVCGTLQSGGIDHLFAWDPSGLLAYTKVKLSSDPVINNIGKIYGSFITRKTEGVFEFNQESVYIWKRQFKNSSWEYPGYPESQSSRAFDTALRRAIVWDVNDLGQILLMNSATTNEDRSFYFTNKYRTWIHENGVFKEITNPSFTVATAINNKSKLLVHLYEYNSFKEIQRRYVGVYTLADKSLLHLPFESDAFGYAINDLGQVVGAYYSPLTSKYCGFWMDDDVGHCLSLDSFIPTALNTKGVLVGYINRTDKVKTPAIWDNGCLRTVTEVADLIDTNGVAWDSVTALTGVNERGEIIGKGVIGGAEHAILLRPLD